MSESKNESDMLSLHQAAIEGDLSMVRLLLETHGGEIARELNANLEYPLYSALFLPAANTAALKTSKEDVFSLLLKHSFDLLTHQNSSGDTVLHRLAKNGFENLVDTILSSKEGVDLLSIKNAMGSYPIHVAILNGQIEVVKKLLSQHGIAEQLDADDNSPLHLAAGFGSLEMVKICLEHCREGINAKNSQDKTPLDLAAVNNVPEVQVLLSDNGAIRNPDSEWSSTFVFSSF